MKKQILILCTGNSARSQMAEGWLRQVAGDRFDVFSAGSHPTGTVHPGAVAAMREIGVDISGQRSKSMQEYLGRSFDVVLTVCDNAAEACPIFPGPALRLHHGFSDPAKAPAEEQAHAFRAVRDEMADWLRNQFELQERPTP